MIANRHHSRFLSLGFALALTACGGGRRMWTAQTLVAQGITIQPASVFVRGPLLEVRTVFINQTPGVISVDRDAVSVVLPDGHAIQRSSGMTTVHTPYLIPPGGQHAVWVDFRSEGFQWASVPGAQVNWGAAVQMNGAPLALPPMAVQQ